MRGNRKGDLRGARNRWMTDAEGTSQENYREVVMFLLPKRTACSFNRYFYR